MPKSRQVRVIAVASGNGGQMRYADAPILDTFTACAPEILHWPWRSAMFKTLYRNDGLYAKPGVHRPRAPDPSRLAEARWYDGQGRALPDTYRTQRIFSRYGRPNYALAQLNHYPLGSMESYLLKVARGRAVHSDDRLGMDYWVERNWTQDQDTSIHRYRTASAETLAALKADPDLARLHDAAVAWRQRRFDELMTDDSYRALFGRLLMTPPARPISPGDARFLTAHAQKRNTGQD